MLNIRQFRKTALGPNLCSVRQRRLYAKVLLTLCALYASTFVPSALAQQPATGSSAMTFVSVEKHETEPLCCYNLSDRPSASDSYEYDVALKQGCTVYTARYDNFDDYFPAFHPGQSVNAKINKHTMVLSTPSGARLRMPILSRSNAAGCYRK